MEFSAKQGKLCLNDAPISLRGINWFGLEGESRHPHAGWGNSVKNYIKILKDNQFNAVRFTMSAEVMENMDTFKVQHVDEGRNPGMSGMTAGQYFDTVVRECKNAGILVMLNMHRMKPNEDISELWYTPEYPEKRVIDAWLKVVARYKNSPHVFAVDIKNEPHGKSLWGGSDPSCDWAAAIERIGNAIHSVNPKLLIFAAGVTRDIWGDSIEGAIKRPIKLRVANKVVYTPHCYKHWRYPNKEGHNNKVYFDTIFGNVAKTKKYTIVIGEYGYDPRDSVDAQWVQELVSYMKANKLDSSFYWCFNNNGSGNQGLLDSDWQTLHQEKLKIIKECVPKPTTFHL